VSADEFGLDLGERHAGLNGDGVRLTFSLVQGRRQIVQADGGMRHGDHETLEGRIYISEHGKGNVMFFDGSNEGMERTIKQMQALKTLDKRSLETDAH